MTVPISPWTFICPDTENIKLAQSIIRNKREDGSSQIVRSKKPSVNGSFDEPVRKGRKPEVSKNHPSVLKCNELYQSGVPLHRVSIEACVDYSMLARWYDKGWVGAPRKRKPRTTVKNL